MVCKLRKSVALEAIKNNNSEKNKNKKKTKTNRFIKIICFGSNEQDLEIWYNGMPPKGFWCIYNYFFGGVDYFMCSSIKDIKQGEINKEVTLISSQPFLFYCGQ